jgi:hypothetical protein
MKEIARAQLVAQFVADHAEPRVLNAREFGIVVGGVVVDQRAVDDRNRSGRGLRRRSEHAEARGNGAGDGLPGHGFSFSRRLCVGSKLNQRWQ